MANTYKVLGQAAPANTSNVNLYTVPTGTAAVVSTLNVANVTALPATCRIYVRISGAAATAGNAIVYDVEIAENSIFAMTAGMTLAAGDIITVASGSAGALTYTLFGSEVN